MQNASRFMARRAAKPISRSLRRMVRRLMRRDDGGVGIYAAFGAVMLASIGAFSIDIGRMAVLRSEMQNRADAGALAAASQLDGKDGAMDRASAMALNATKAWSGMVSDSDQTLGVASVNFYSSLDPLTAATGDEDAAYAQVVLDTKTMSFIFEPMIDATVSNQTSMNASATAQPDPYICHAPPLMICDLGELDATIDLESDAVVGRQVLLKPAPSSGTSSWGAGNWGLLALPDGSKGASAIESALAAEEPEDCYTLDVTTATGVKTNKVQSGINSRFDDGGPSAPNIIHYPQDDAVASGGIIGDGGWDVDTYWADTHGTTLPVDLADASRYQVYLYELGLTFARNGKLTAYPLDDGVPSGYTTVTPAGADIPVSITDPDDPTVDGVPSMTVASNGYERRLLKVAVLQCVAEGVSGSHTYPTDGRYLEIFVTEAVPDSPEGAIYGEIVRSVTPSNDPDFHANVRLVE